MNRYLVTYDLVGTDETSGSYEHLIDAIKAYGYYGKIQKSVWLIKTSDSSSQLFDSLWARMDANDRLFVTSVTAPASWQNTLCGTEWIQGFYT